MLEIPISWPWSIRATSNHDPWCTQADHVTIHVPFGQECPRTSFEDCHYPYSILCWQPDDPSLLKEIEANASSLSPINHMARELLPTRSEDTRKRKREELESRKAEAELCCSIIEKYASVINTYTALCLNQDRDIDDQAKAIFKELLLHPASSISDGSA